MILIALGANLPSTYGTPEETLEAAKSALGRLGVRIVSSSKTILAAPVPVSDQPWYRNAVVAVETALGPLALLNVLHKVEAEFGRVRTVRNAPRLLDLDLIAYHDEVIEQDDVFIPHPRLHERGFVLLPLREIAADWVHPVLKRSVEDLIAALPNDQRAEFVETDVA